jgi:hypothetical protein
MGHKRLRCTVVLALGACTVTNDDDGFATATTPTSVTVGSTVTNTGSDGSSTAAGDSTTAGDAGSDGSTGGDDTGSTTSSTTPDPTLDGSSSDGAVDPTDGQPADGMWSMCIDAAMDCGNLPILCITNADMTDGFCSTTGCANPAADCDPSPGGTATPACAPVTVNDEMEQACVLSCAGGLVCPTGMVCMDFTNLGMICM